MKRTYGKIAMLMCMIVLAVSVVIGTANTTYAQETQASPRLDFINEAPAQTTEYPAGEGVVIYQPTGENAATITLRNATLYAVHSVKYQKTDPVKSIYTALAATGDIALVLEGNNTIYLNASNSCRGMVFYDSNVTVTGSGSLTIGYEQADTYNFNANPIEVMGDYDVLNGRTEGVYTDSGNFYMQSGTLMLKNGRSSGLGSLTAHNDIVISGGNVITDRDKMGLYSVYHDILIRGGKVTCREFLANGLYARRGNVCILGEDTYVDLQSSVGDFGIAAEAALLDTGETRATGNVQIDGGHVQIASKYIGIYALYDAQVAGSGNVFINGGQTEIDCTGKNNFVAGIFAEGNDDSRVAISGGKVTIRAEHTGSSEAEDYKYAIGIYGDGAIALTGGETDITAQGNDTILSYAVSATQSVAFSGGKATMRATTAITDHVPQMGDKIQAQASANTDGSALQDYDANRYAEYRYLQYSEKATVERVEVSADQNTVQAGGSLQFHAQVQGSNVTDGQVQWSVAGATSADTKIDANGLLTIGKDEKATTLTITATSMLDQSVCGTFVVQLQSSPQGLPGGAIAGIVVGVLVLVAAVVGVSVWLVRRHKKQPDSDAK